ncbi:MAG TPA: hypothetical protein VKH35_00090 [Thermoanaerobaculia bacterium]|nr:hypothetical protein [Thermoanaerobaculia bacterium]
MTEGHRRHLGSSVRYIGRLLEEARRLAADERISPSAGQELTAALDDVDRALGDFAGALALDSRGPAIPPLQAIRAQLSVISIAVDEMRPRALRGYGDLDRGTAAEIDLHCDRLDEAVGRAQQTAARTEA